MAHFLDGLVIHRRGKDDSRPPQPIELPVTNNLILKKLRVAFELKEDDLHAILKSVNFPVSKPELSALFRKAGHDQLPPVRRPVAAQLPQGPDPARARLIGHAAYGYPGRHHPLLFQGKVRHPAPAATGARRTRRARAAAAVRPGRCGRGAGTGQPCLAAVPVPPGTGRQTPPEGAATAPGWQQEHGCVRHPRHSPAQWHRPVGGAPGRRGARAPAAVWYRPARRYAGAGYQTVCAVRR
ncbi:hypothetical protein PPS11_09614 [Pseudomonas putida S11]|nr:hypothetical protein PPS11_09614 [Pseudomonas putida S11]